MIPVPTLTHTDMIFGRIPHLPPYKEIPAKFKRSSPFNDYVSDWFFSGKPRDDIDRLVPKDGVDKPAALAAVKAILSSFEPSHEHKEAGAAYLLSEWFTLAPKASK